MSASSVFVDSRPIRYIRRGQVVSESRVGASRTLLDYLREDLGQTGSKEGCAEAEMGLNTKVCMVVADELGVPFPSVRITAANTDRVPNASATAASASTDMNGRAAQMAARKIKQRLVKFLAERDDCAPGAVVMAGGSVITPRGNQTFTELVQAAWMEHIQLWSDGFYRTPKINWDGVNLSGRPFYYFVYGTACAEVAIDTSPVRAG